LIFGAVVDESLEEDQVVITVIATGFDHVNHAPVVESRRPATATNATEAAPPARSQEAATEEASARTGSRQGRGISLDFDTLDVPPASRVNYNREGK
jgi:cell division GTPase FtsZ